jgi:catechol 2,3-dioxygenase-like lactoylglutathione lyase family enzyme
MRTQLNAAGLVVADLAVSTAFYARLGLVFTDDDGDGHAQCDLPGGLHLMLDTVELIKSITPDWTPASGSPRVAFAFEVDAPEQVDAVHAELLEAGGQPYRAPWDAFWGQRYASVLDPDGNGVDIYATLPGSAG